jgi:uncharacterized membrane-anchored protein
MAELGASKRLTRRLLWLVVAQVLFLLAVAGSYYATGLWGKEIRLKTVPVDPRDILYGDYVRLSYEISSLKPELWKEPGSEPERGDVIYVVLKPDHGLYQPAAAYRSKPQTVDDEVVLKGRVDYSWNEAIAVKYGLEKYYVPEGTGQDLEKKASDMVVRVKVAPWGQAKISGLEQDDS